jgi:hypothetical protein
VKDAVLKFSPWEPGIAAGCAGVSIDPLIGALKWFSGIGARASVITSKPAISYHFKTGQRNHTQDQMMFYRAG